MPGCNPWIAFCTWFHRSGERLFYLCGGGIASHPTATILIGLFLVGCLCPGFVLIQRENRTVKIFIPQESPGIKDLDKGQQHFNLKLREETVILIPKHGKEILSEECFKEALEIHKAIQNLPSYTSLCATWSEKRGNLSSCLFINPVEVFGFEDSRIINVSSTIAQESIPPSTIVMRNGRPFYQNFRRMFGGISRDPSSGLVEKAEALRVVYYLNDASTDEEFKKISDWEMSFIHAVSSLQNNMTCGEMFYAAERSLDDAIDDSSSSDIKRRMPRGKKRLWRSIRLETTTLPEALVGPMTQQAALPTLNTRRRPGGCGR